MVNIVVNSSHIQQKRSNVSIHLECGYIHFTTQCATFTLLFALFCSQLLKKISGSSAAKVVSSFAFLLFGAGQIVYSWHLDVFCWKQLPAAAEKDANKSNKRTAELGNNSLWSCH